MGLCKCVCVCVVLTATTTYMICSQAREVVRMEQRNQEQTCPELFPFVVDPEEFEPGFPLSRAAGREMH